MRREPGDGEPTAPDMAEADEPVRWETGQPLLHAIDARRDTGTKCFWRVVCFCGEWQRMVYTFDRVQAVRFGDEHLAEVGE